MKRKKGGGDRKREGRERRQGRRERGREQGRRKEETNIPLEKQGAFTVVWTSPHLTPPLTAVTLSLFLRLGFYYIHSFVYFVL